MLKVWPIHVTSLDLIGQLGCITFYMFNIYNLLYYNSIKHTIITAPSFNKEISLHFLWLMHSMSSNFVPIGTYSTLSYSVDF